MAIHPLMRAALKALSAPDLDLEKNYRTHRRVVDAAHPHVLRPFYRIWDHAVDAGDHRIPVRVFAPRRSGAFPVLLFFHGGGWVTGSINSYDKVCTVLAQRTGHVVFSVDYRLAPEHRFPAGLEDCYLVARELYQCCQQLGIPSGDITIMGDSAGGNLAAAVSLLARDRGEFSIRRQILLYPATNNDYSDASPFASVRENGTDYLLTAQRLREYLDLYQSCPEDRQSPYFAPILAQDLSHQPETLIITAQFDPLRDEGEAYGRRLLEAGNFVEMHCIRDALHGFFSMGSGFLPVKKAYRYINAFLSRPTVQESLEQLATPLPEDKIAIRVEEMMEHDQP